VFGLIRAIERFDILRGGEFEAFAFSRVQGAMIDECRKHTVVSRHYRAMVKKMDRAREVLTRELGREPSHDEVCDRAGVTGQSRESVVRHSREPEFVPVSEEVVREEFSNLSTDLEEVESLLRFLDEEDQMVIRLEWVEGRSATAVQKILRIPTDDIAGVRQRAMANFIQCWRERYSKREGVCCVAS
jgi:RNA polymerase sigma factor for flagellar operon FliA